MSGETSCDPRSLRILQVIPVLAQGGAEKMGTLLATTLREQGAHVSVAAKTRIPERYGGPAVELPLRATGMPIHHVERARQRPWPLLRSAWQLASVLRVERPDVVHAHNPAAATSARLARALVRMPRMPIVATYHGVRPERVRAAVRALLFGADIIVGVGPSSTEELARSGVPRRRLATVYNGVAARAPRPRDATRRELGVPLDAELVVNVARYEAQKDQRTLVDALAELLPDRPRLHALIVGIGTLEEDLRSYTERLGISDRVRVVGAREDATDVMAAADVFALSSVWEALPLVLVEAMIVRAAVVTTRAGGVTDVAHDRETALVVPVRDTRALAAAIGELLDDAALRERIATAAAAFVAANCTPDAMAAGYCRVYRDAIGRRQPA